MFLLGGGGGKQANQAPAASGLQIQTSAYGKVIPIVVGAMRTPPNLLWYGDFSATAHRNQSGGKGGVGGGGGGKNGGGSIYYTYATSFVYGLCEGEISGIGLMWKDKNRTTPAEQGMTVMNGTYPQAAWGYLETNHGYLFESRTIPATGPYTVAATYNLPFLVDNGVFSEIEMVSSAPPPPANKYSLSNQGKTYTFNAADAGKAVRLISDLDAIARPGSPVLNQTPGGALAGATYYVRNTYVTPDGETTGSAIASFVVSTNFLLTVASPEERPGITGWNVYIGASAATLKRQNASPIAIGDNFTEDPSGILPGVKPPTTNSTGGYISLDATIPAVAPYVINWDRQADAVFLRSVVFTKVGGAPALNQYSVDSSGVYTFNSGNAGNQVTVSYSAGNQNPAFQAVGYNGLAWVGASGYALGQSPNLGNHNFEVLGLGYHSVGSLPDADPSIVVTEFLSNPQWGAGFPEGKIGDLTTYQDYVCATGLLLSFELTAQTPCADVLESIALVTNSAFVWSESTLKLIPYGDEDVTGNGHTYIAPTAPLFDLDDDDFLQLNEDDDPIRLSRKRATDAINWLQMEFRDRANDYNPGMAEAKNQAFIDLYGLRPNPDSASTQTLFADATAAQASVNLMLQRQLVLNTYEFDTDFRYIVLDPMDIITITDPGLGLDRQWVRVKEIKENGDFSLTFTVEEFMSGIASAPVYAFQESSGYAANYNQDPGDVNEPIIFECPTQLATNGGLETWMAVSGPENWGGCDVWISADGDTYAQVGRISGNTRMGVLTQQLLAGDDPDLAHTLSVDLSQSFGNLISGTQADADQGNTLCYVDGELVAYASANLTESYSYDLTYLRRGMYGTTNETHAAGTKFARLDNQVFEYGYDKTQIGQTIYIKFLSFNQFGGGLQSLSEVSPYAHTIIGPPIPADVTGFTAQQHGGTVGMSWNQIPNDYGLKGYNLTYGPQGGTFDASVFLTQAERGTEMTNASVPPGSWTFYIVAVDIADQESNTPAMYDLVVTNENEVLSSRTYAPDWVQNASLPISNFFQHYTGVLVPLSENLASSYVPLSAPATPVLSEESGGTMLSDTYFVVITYTTDGGETLPSAEDSFTTTDNHLLTVDSPAISGNATGFNVYVGTTTGVTTLQTATPIGIGSNWTMPLTGLVAGASPPAINSTGWEVFDTFVPDPIALATFTGSDIDEGFIATFRVWATAAFALGPGESGNAAVGFNLAISDTDFAGIYDFEPWTIGQVTTRYLAGQVSYAPVAGAVAYVQDLTFVIDAPLETGTATNVAIGSGGTTINFADYPQMKAAYHLPPSVQVTVSGGTGTSGVAINVTTTGAEIHVYNGSVGVAGTTNITVTGV